MIMACARRAGGRLLRGGHSTVAGATLPPPAQHVAADVAKYTRMMAIGAKWGVRNGSFQALELMGARRSRNRRTDIWDEATGATCPRRRSISGIHHRFTEAA